VQEADYEKDTEEIAVMAAASKCVPGSETAKRDSSLTKSFFLPFSSSARPALSDWPPDTSQTWNWYVSPVSAIRTVAEFLTSPLFSTDTIYIRIYNIPAG
jgi:hypothetical protein